MPKTKLCLGLLSDFCEDDEKQIYMIKDAGFNEIFFSFTDEETLKKQTDAASKAGLTVRSVHAPYGGCRALWESGEEEAKKAAYEITRCIHACAENGVSLMVSHAFIGFDIPPIPVEKGLQRYYELINEAGKYGVTIAFENTEGEEYLEAILKNFGRIENVGFCWDTGHEICYNRGADLLKRYGKLLACTHINDNLGIKDTGGKTTWRDDLHLLPFDGIIDWEYNAKRLARENYNGTLTFELKIASKPGRHENDIYALMPPESYLAEIFKRACRFEALVCRAKERRGA